MDCSLEFSRLKQAFGWSIGEHASWLESVWHLHGRSDHSVSYPAEGNVECAAVEERSYWFQHRNRILATLVQRFKIHSLWDVGSGNGFVSRALQECGTEVVAVEPGRFGAQCAARRGIRNSVCGFFEDLHLPDNSISSIGCFDVLEHIEDTSVVLSEFHRTLEAQGLLLVTVPGLPALWSKMDVIGGHFRRYTKGELHRSLSTAGFIRKELGYFMCPLAIPMWIRCRLLGENGVKPAEMPSLLVDPLPKVLMRVLQLFLDVESFVIRSGFPQLLPFGSSLYGVYEKA